MRETGNNLPLKGKKKKNRKQQINYSLKINGNDRNVRLLRTGAHNVTSPLFCLPLLLEEEALLLFSH